VPSVPNAPRRIPELDSIRGLAALTVLSAHLTHFWSLTGTEVRLVTVLAYDAVVVFFVLSGLVLALPFYRADVAYKPFLIRRFFRIYPPYLAAILVALAASSLVARRGLPSLDGWFNRQWLRTPSPASLVEHLSLVWSFPQHHPELDWPIWSLVIEMRVSLFFPLVVAGVFALGVRRTLILLPVVSVVGIFASHASFHVQANDWFETVKYLPMFAVGILIAGRLDWIAWRARRLPTIAWVAIVAAMVFVQVIVSNPVVGELVVDLCAAIAAVATVTVVLAPHSLRELMLRGPLVALGRISYSLYLFHVIVILAVANILEGHASSAVMAATAALLSIVAAIAGYRLVELPAMNLGRRLAGRDRERTPVAREAPAT
jgi:peptidoglycan/LPS O-acetylase OafA/YrhL